MVPVNWESVPFSMELPKLARFISLLFPWLPCFTCAGISRLRSLGFVTPPCPLRSCPGVFMLFGPARSSIFLSSEVPLSFCWVSSLSSVMLTGDGSLLLLVRVVPLVWLMLLRIALQIENLCACPPWLGTLMRLCEF